MSNTSGSGEFSVFDMATEMASQRDEDIHELFRRNPVSGNVAREDAEATGESIPAPPTEEPATPPAKKPWTPSAEAMAELPELQKTHTTYSREELEVKDEGLKNIVDEEAKQEAADAMNELERKLFNIEEAKKRHGISKFQIPEGQFTVNIHCAAIDTNYSKAQKNLDEVFDVIKKQHPEFILEWLPGWGPDGYNAAAATPTQQNAPDMIELPEGTVPANPAEQPEDPPSDFQPFKTPAPHEGPIPGAAIADETPKDPDVKINIDKRNVNQIAWSPEEVEKIKRARTVELNIIEGRSLKFGEIEDVPQNAVASVLSQYQRKTNDIPASLPASRYRCTFTGLSYPEVLDLSNSNEMNNIDGEIMKWTIAFRHIKNQSIGPWREYKWYIDPETKKRVELELNQPLPAGIEEDIVTTVTKFDDFMMKTSFMDLEYMLWKILCATTMDEELISIDCHAIWHGKTCNKSYDWIYKPNDLLLIDSVDPAVLEEMRVTGEVAGDDILKNYLDGPVSAQNTVQLSTSGFQVVFGHISAYEHVHGIYNDIKRFEDEEANSNDPLVVSKGLNYSTLTIIKAILLPKPEGGWYRITRSDNIVEILHELDEVDWQTISEICRMMITPYQFDFALRDIVCPQCGNRSSIPIDSMKRILFIVARSLSNVQVELKRD